MNDETQQMREMLFDRIVLGLILVGVITALSSLAIGGFASPWFYRAIALIIVALVAFGLRRVSQFVVAAYVLVLELFGIVTAIFIQAGTIGFIPYLFVLIIIIAGLILSPTATMVLGLVAILLMAVIVVLAQGISWAGLVALLPPFSLIIVVQLLVIEGRRHLEKLGEHLVETRKLLRERTLGIMEAQETISQLQTRTEELKQQLLTHQAEAHQAQQTALQKNQGLYQLIKGAIEELDSSVEDLERFIDQISERTSAEEQAGLLEKVWQKIYHLNNLVVNLEDMAQIRNDRITLNYQDVDLATLIGEVVGTTRGLARGKNLEIRAQVPENLPKLQLDPVRIRQALLYILNNAVKYTDQGIIEVQAELNTKELLIFVSDTGIGMHREEMEQIFREFGRGSGTLAKERSGTGLGLTISKGLVELHGGHMWATSVLGVGSTFYINLPLEPPRSQAAAAAPLLVPPIPVATAEEEIPIPALIPIPATDEEETLLSPQPVIPPPTKVKPGFGSPVGRRSSTYIGRFGFILLGLLLIIASIVALLAVFYGPPLSEKEIAATKTGAAIAIASQQDATATATPTRGMTQPTAVPSATPYSTETPQPPATPTLPPTQTATSRPSDTPTATFTSISTSTPVPVPPSPTPAATSTETPTETPTGTPAPIPTNTPQPGNGPTVARIGTQPATVRARPRALSFVANQTVALHLLADASGRSLDQAGNIVSDSNLSWSPGGDQVLFATSRDGNYEIYLARADGSQVLNLTNSNGYDSQPSWSPDGRQIAFSSQRNGNVDIYLMDADGGNLRQLTTGRGYEEWPAWSPDGRKIAFVSDEEGNIEIYIINVDGGNLQRLTDNPADDWPVVWAPDSQQLLFGSNRDGNWNLYIVDAAGGEARQLTADPADEREPNWSPDGRTIAFVYNGGGNWDVYTIPAPTGAITAIPKSEWTQITNTPRTDEHYPAWSP
ncbi:MAG: PD40 domain-containing protein [Anaerolineae bacterium]|nr:PD40 domain-containing protein [Anaerolineae bacterium]